MSFVKGRVLFSKNNSADIYNPLNIGIKKVPIVLRNIDTGEGVGVYSTDGGSFSFLDVPDGVYHIIETASYTPKFDGTTSFRLAKIIEEPTPGDPNINSVVIAEQFEGNRLISLSINMKIIIVQSDDINDIVFLDAPVFEIPYEKTNIFESGPNDIYACDGGSFGKLLPGVQPETSPEEPPYNNITLEEQEYYKYEEYKYGAPTYGKYSISNMIINDNFTNWWNISDHTTGDERGRMQILQSSDGEKVFFMGYVPGYIGNINKDYFFISFWVCNIVKNSINEVPKISVELKPMDDDTKASIFLTFTNNSSQISVPTWRQFGAVIKPTATSYKILFRNIGPKEDGNAFIIDDLSYRYLIPSPTVYLKKKCDNQSAIPGDIVTYDILLKNIGPQALKESTIIDAIPENTTLVENSITIDDIVSDPILEDEINVRIPFIDSGELKKISYSVKINENIKDIPKIISNRAQCLYKFSNPMNELESFQVRSKEVSIRINYDSNLIVNQFVDKDYVKPGDILTYDIIIKNNGLSIIKNIRFVDTIPNYTLYLEDSLYINKQPSPTNIDLSNLDIPDLEPMDEFEIQFKVRVDSDINLKEISNKFLLKYTEQLLAYEYTEEITETLKNIITKTVEDSAIVNVVYPNIKITKIANIESVKLLQEILYTVTISNEGNIKADSLTLSDTLDSNTSISTDSIIVDGEAFIGLNDLSRIEIINLNPSEIKTINYIAIVNSVPESSKIINSAKVDYTFMIEDSEEIERATTDVASVEIEYIPTADIEFRKEVFPQYIDSHTPLITYFVHFNNNIEKAIKSLIIVDTIPEGTELHELSINESTQPVSNLSKIIKIELSDKEIQEENTIRFLVKCNDFISRSSLKNQAYAKYNESAVESQAVSLVSNEVETVINQAILNVECIDYKVNGYVDGLLSYTFKVENTGTIIATNVYFTNNLPEELELVPNSVRINNQLDETNQDIANLKLPDLEKEAEIRVAFSARIKSLPIANKITNIANVNYDYYFDFPNKTILKSSEPAISDPVETNVYESIVADCQKFVKPDIGEPSGELEYFLVLKNTHSIPIRDIKFMDSIPKNTVLVSNSILLDGVIQENSLIGIDSLVVQKESLLSKAGTTVTFKVKINADQDYASVIENKATLQYVYDKTTQKLYSNTTITIIYAIPSTSFRKFVNKDKAELGDELIYSLVFQNNSSVADCSNVTFIDTIPIGTKLIPKSIFINDVLYDTETERVLEVLIPVKILPSNTITATYRVRINNLPQENTKEIKNVAYVSFVYYDLKNKRNLQGYESEEVITRIEAGGAELRKFADKQVVDNGDQLKYKFGFLRNKNEQILEADFYDTIPDNTNYVEGSFEYTFTGSKGQEVDITDEGRIHFSLTSSQIDHINRFRAVEFSYKVTVNVKDNIPDKISNEAYIGYKVVGDTTGAIRGITSFRAECRIAFAKLTVEMKVDKSKCSVGEVLHYEIIMRNIGNVEATGITLSDVLIEELTLVPDSITQNKIKYYSQDLIALSINNILKEEERIIEFDARVNKSPSNNEILNYVSIKYRYLVETLKEAPVLRSNPVITQVSPIDIGVVDFTKDVDMISAAMGDQLKYTLRLRNTKYNEITNINIIDTIPDNTIFINGSIMLDENLIDDIDPPRVQVPSLVKGSEIIFRYLAKINEDLNNINEIRNRGYCSYEYLNQSNVKTRDELESSEVITSIDSSLENIITKSVDKTTASVEDELLYTLVIENKHSFSIQEVKIKDFVTVYTELVPNTVVYNGVVKPISENGKINIEGPEVLQPGEKATLKYRVTIIGVPDDIKKLSSFKAELSYKFNDLRAGKKIGYRLSNLVVTNLDEIPKATITKVADKKYADFGEIIKYDVYFVNTTGRTLTRVIINDYIPQFAYLIPNTIKVNGELLRDKVDINVQKTQVLNNDRIHISYQVQTIEISVIDAQITSPPATAIYNIGKNPSITIETKPSESMVKLRGVKLQVLDYYPKESNLYSTITYILGIGANIGNVEATNVVFEDLLPSELELDINAIEIGDRTIVPRSVNPLTLDIGRINPNEPVKSIRFSAKIVRIPDSGEISHVAKVDYNYIVDLDTRVSKSGKASTVSMVTKVKDIPKAKLIKSVNTNLAGKDDNLNYTVTFINETQNELTNITITDEVPENTKIDPDSLLVNGEGRSSSDRSVIVISERLAIGGRIDIQYTVTVAIGGKPELEVIENKATANYAFVDSPQDFRAIESITTSTQLRYAKFSINKSVNKPVAYPGDVLTYTIEVTNLGNTNAANVYIEDVVLGDVTLVPNSITVVGVTLNDGTLSRIPIGNVLKGEEKEIQFSVRINSSPASNEIINTATVNYAYEVKSPADRTGQDISNSIRTTIGRVATILFTKTVNSPYAGIDNNLIYQIYIKNNINEDISSAKFIDTLPDGLTKVVDSVKVRGVKQAISGDNANVIDIELGAIAKEEIVNISYDSKIDGDQLTSNDIENVAYLGYKSSSNLQKLIWAESSKATTFIRYANLVIEKNVDKEVAYVGEKLTYTITLRNTGNKIAEEVRFSDNLQAEVRLISDSIKINNRRVREITDLLNVKLPNIPKRESRKITFECEIINLPQNEKVMNQSIVRYSYIYQSTPKTKSNTERKSNVDITKIDSKPEITFTKTADKNYADIGNELTYTIYIRNSGSKLLIENYISDNLPKNLRFKEGTLMVEGIESSDPLTKINIPDLDENREATIKYKVEIIDTGVDINEITNDAILNFSYIDISKTKILETQNSNTVQTTINHGKITVRKEVIKPVVSLNGIQGYKITITNIGNRTVRELILNDDLSEYLEVVPNSIKVNNKVIQGISTLRQLNLGQELNLRGIIEVEFKAKVILVPLINIILNTSSVDFKYEVDPVLKVFASRTAKSNEVRFSVRTEPKISISKTVDKDYASKDEELKYTITITNESEETIYDCNVTDDSPLNTVFVRDSLMIGNEIRSGDLAYPGLSIGNITKTEQRIISYRVRVSAEDYNFNEITNQAGVEYYYSDDYLGRLKGSKFSEIVKTGINYVKLNVNKSVDQSRAYVNDILTYTIDIVNVGNTIADNVELYEVISENTELVKGSVRIKTESNVSDILYKRSLGILAENQSTKVTFSVRVISKPVNGNIENTAQVGYRFKVNPLLEDSWVADIRISSVAITEIIDKSYPIFTKSVDKRVAINGETLQYNLSFRNNTSNILRQVTIVDVIPNNSDYVENTLNAEGSLGGIRERTITLKYDFIGIQDVKNISYQVKINARNSSVKYIKNIADVSYREGSDVAPIIKQQTQVVSTSVKIVNVIVQKWVNKIVAKINDILIYKITIEGKGDVNIHDIVLSESVPYYITIIDDSLIINGKIRTGPYDFSSINLNEFHVNKRIVVEYQARLISILADNKITTISNVNYKYEVTPSRILSQSVSVEAVTNVQYVPEVTLSKSVDKFEVDKNEELKYTLVLRNNGPQEITDINIIDTIPENIETNNAEITIDNNISKYSLQLVKQRKAVLMPNEEFKIVYKARIIAIPQKVFKLTNEAFANYKYVDLQGNIYSNAVKSSSVTTNIQFCKLAIVKTVNKTRVRVGGILKYTVIITNVGSIEATRVIFMETLAEGLTLEPNSVTIGTGTVSGTQDLRRLEIGTIMVGESKIITFNVKLTKVSESKRIQNRCGASYIYYVGGRINTETEMLEDIKVQAYTDIPLGRLVVDSDYSNECVVIVEEDNIVVVEKSVDKLIAAKEDILTYNLVVNNNGNYEIVDNTLIDILSDNINFVQDSLIIDGENYSGTLEKSSFKLRSLAGNKVMNIQFKARVTNAISGDNIIVNSAVLNYSLLREDGMKEPLSIKSNEVRTEIITERPKLTVNVKKMVDKEIAEANEVLTYKVVITNTSEAESINVMLKENLSPGLKIVDNSLIVNNAKVIAPLNSLKFGLGNIKMGTTSTIEFKAQVDSTLCLQEVSNYAEVEYQINSISDINKTIVKSEKVITQIIVPMRENYGKYTLMCKRKAVKIGIVPLKKVIIKGKSILDCNKSISLSWGKIFKAQWSIVLKVEKGKYKLEGMLALNKKIIQESTSVVEGMSICCKLITITGNATFRTQECKSFLNLIYCCNSNNIDIVGASLKILE